MALYGIERLDNLSFLELSKQFLPHITVSLVQTSCFKKLIKSNETHTISNQFDGTFKLSFLTHGKPKQKKNKTEDLNEKGMPAETGNSLLPSTHCPMQMSTPLREHPHVNIMSSGHNDSNEKNDSMGNQ